MMESFDQEAARRAKMKADQNNPVKQYVPKPEPSISDQIIEKKREKALTPAEKQKAYRERKKEGK